MNQKKDLNQTLDQTYRSELEAWLSQPAISHLYCGCFSAKPDDLSQWRGYADDGRGVSLGVDLQLVADEGTSEQGGNIEIVEVVYDSQVQREMALNILNRATDHSPTIEAAFAYTILRHLAPKMKNPAFEDEKETRVVYSPSTQFSYPFALEALPTVDFHLRNGRLIPFVEIPFPKFALKELWLGPRFNDDEAAAIKLYLKTNEMTDDVERSNATYRGHGN